MSYEPSYPPEPEVISPLPVTQPDRKGLAIASLVLGLLSLFSFCLVFCAGPLGLAGIITGIAGLKSSQRGLAIAGIVLSGLGLVISVILALIGVALLPAWTDIQNWNWEFGPEQFIP
jgi:hypothetical protein